MILDKETKYYVDSGKLKCNALDYIINLENERDISSLDEVYENINTFRPQSSKSTHYQDKHDKVKRIKRL